MMNPRDKIVKDWYGDDEYRELELGEKIMDGDMYLYENAMMRSATDTGSGIYTTHHWPHYRLIDKLKEVTKS
jgi:hypothetical protein